MKKSTKTQTPNNKKSIPSEKTKRKRKTGSPHEKDHDALAKVGFSDIKGVQGLLKTELPDDLKAALDFSTLKRISDSYIDDNLKGTFSDKAFTCQSLIGETAVIAFICEHKSYIPTEPIYIQLLQYEINHWRETALAGQDIACIITIVLYHGEKDWDIKPFNAYFNLKTPVFNRFIPQFDIIFINLRSMPEEKIMTNPLLGKLRAVLMALKYSHYPNVLLEYFEIILNFVVDSDGNKTEVEIRYTNAVLEYLLRRTPITEEEFLEKIDYLNDDLKNMGNSTYDNIYNNAYNKAITALRAEMQAKAQADAAEIQVDAAEMQTGAAKMQAKMQAKIKAKAKTDAAKIQAKAIADAAEMQTKIRAEIQAEMQTKPLALVLNLITETNFNDDKIANLANVPLEFVKMIREQLVKKP